VTGFGEGSDDGLRNERDVGMQTSVRLKAVWAVRVAEGTATLPNAPAGHNHYALATLARRKNTAAVEPSMITDLRRKRLNLADLEGRVTAMEVALLLPSLLTPAGDLQPLVGTFGDPVGIFGSNLDKPGLSILFGTVPVTEILERSNDHLTVKVPRLDPPPGGIKVKVKVSTRFGVATSRSDFTVKRPDEL
jgi:hypothetical protein